MNSEKYEDLIEILGGEKKIDELYKILGSQKISIISLKRFLKYEKIKTSYDQKKSIAKIAKENSVAKITVYRLIRKFRRCNKKIK
ncbi:MAG TPA: hypothetical protein VJY62_14150 [Bacteroidia bacterium]|nr:hypothetical protein [Bacteroidia bacterium]